MNKEQIIEEAQHLSGMLGSEGWKVLEKEAIERIGNLSEVLISSDDIDQIRTLQANIRGLKFLLSFPAEMLETAKRVTEQEAPPPDEDA